MNYKFDGDKVFFTSDTHFNHTNIIQYCQRPFKSTDEMNEAMIVEKAREFDPFGHAGFDPTGFTADRHSHRCSLRFHAHNRLNGKIYLILGNHDLKNIRQGFIERFEHIAMAMRIDIGKKKIYLSHYPYLCFEGGYKDDVWQLFGHVHTRPSNTGIDASRLQYLYPTQLDVGVDNNNFTPLSFEQVSAKILKQIETTRK